VKSSIISSRYSFALFYAIIVTLGTQLVLNLPVLIQMEYAIYDPIQRWFTIDSEDDSMFSKYAQELNGIYGINLDNSFFDPETSRIDRKRLSDLLLRLQEHTNNLIFLDFLFEPLTSFGCQNEIADSLLVECMKPMKDRLVMPYDIDLASIKVCEGYSANHIKKTSSLEFYPTYSGFTAPMFLEGDNLVRYHLIKIKDTTEISAVYALLEAKHGERKAKELFENVPNKFEINFVLRNKKKSASYDALLISNGNQLMDWPKEVIAENLKNKIVFIGRFKSKEDHLDNQIDGFNTPIKSDLNGIYFLINAYLNIVKDNYLRKANFWIVFFINLIITLLGLFFLKNQKNESIRTVSQEIRHISIVIIVFGALLIGLYLCYSIKFPFVVSSIAFIKLDAIKNYYGKIVSKKYSNTLKPSN